MNDVHTCGGGLGEGQRRATRQWLTGIIKDKLNENPLVKPKDIARDIYEDYGLALTYSQVLCDTIGVCNCSDGGKYHTGLVP